MNKNAPRFLTHAALIAAVYAALTLILQPISYGSVQLRVSEALCILPLLTPAAVPGLFLGCLIANLLGGCSLIDIIFGSLTTLIAAGLTRHWRQKPVWALLPVVLLNALSVGLILSFTANLPLLLTMLWIALGEAAACYGLGLPFLKLLRKTQMDRRLF